MKDSITDAVAGAFAGALTKTLVAPLDRLKLVVQLRGSISSSSSSSSVATTASTSATTTAKARAGENIVQQQYKGPWLALSKIIQEEGFFALWRGNLPTILIQGGTSALNFMFMSWYMNAATRIVGGVNNSNGDDDGDSQQQQTTKRLIISLLSGGLAGGTAITILYPIGLIRTKLALDVGKTNNRLYPNGMKDVVWKSIQVNGISSLYKGYFVALASVSSYRMIYLGGYDFLKKELSIYKRKQKHPQESKLSSDTTSNNEVPSSASVVLPMYERLVVAQLVSMVASTFHYPLDTIRRRLMMQSDMEKPKYKHAMDCLKKIYQEEGIGGYYRGLGTNYIRSIGAALVLVSYDYFKSILSS